MAKIILLPTFTDNRGSLTVIEKILPFEMKRVYFIYDSEGQKRGFHKHKVTKQALVTSIGSCKVNVKNNQGIKQFNLDSPNKCLILEPEDYHWMHNFRENTVLLVIASEYFDKNDYLGNDIQ